MTSWCDMCVKAVDVVAGHGHALDRAFNDVISGQYVFFIV